MKITAMGHQNLRIMVTFANIGNVNSTKLTADHLTTVYNGKNKAVGYSSSPFSSQFTDKQLLQVKQPATPKTRPLWLADRTVDSRLFHEVDTPFMTAHLTLRIPS